jgi:predicted HTH domain antitoxin
MRIEVPDVTLGSEPLTADQARLALAVGLYTGRKLSVGRAAQVAGLPKVHFIEELSRRGIGLAYRLEDFAHDVQMAEELGRKAA